MQADNSWDFLKEFYFDDPSIAKLVSKALEIKSKKKVRTDSWDYFFEDIISSLPKNSSDKTTYLDLLSYVMSKDIGIIDDPCSAYCPLMNPKGCKKNHDAITEKQEYLFIDKLWSNISAKSSVSALVSKRFITTGIPPLLLPYLILYSLGIKRDWFLYGGNSESYIVDVDGKDDNKRKLREIYDTLKKSSKKLQNLPLKLKKIIYKLYSKKLSSESLYPLMTLLIVLRREWKLSKTEEYVKLKKESLSNILIKTNDTKINALIFGLYKHYKDADEVIMNDIKHCKIPPIEIHPLVAKHIIESKSFKPLFNPDIKLSKTGIGNGKDKGSYSHIEQKLDNNYSGKRLLVDYLFPITEIRENDVFVPSADYQFSLIDRIYLSLILGKDYKNYWREPQKGELFDRIQLQPQKNTSGEYDDTRLIDYRGYLEPNGEFLFVWSKENDTINESIEKELSNFRHDLKSLTDDVSIGNLKCDLNNIIQYTQVFQETVEDIDCFLNNPTDQLLFEVAKKSIKEVANNSNLQDFVQKPEFSTTVRKIRIVIKDFNQDTQSIESLKTYIKDLKHLFIRACIDCISTKCMRNADSFEYTYTTLCDYISIAGVSKFDRENTIDINIIEFLERYIKYPPNKAKCAKLLKDFSNIENNITIKSDETILKVILDSIVENAITHGFPEDYHCDSPKIIFVLQESGDYMILKVCNNGREIDITTDDYKTRGVFRGTTGHTGLGGFQISKYAEMLGGYVVIPEKKDREWNTEIHLYLKK